MHGLKQQLRQPGHQRNEPGMQQRSRQERTGEKSADAASRSPLEDETGPQSHHPGVGVPGLEGIEDPLDVSFSREYVQVGTPLVGRDSSIG